MSIYCIGGSPCSGKSTVAQRLAETYGLAYFKVDDHLDQWLQRGAEDGLPACSWAAKASPGEIWMRPPRVQCREELRIYTEIFPYVLEALGGVPGPVITEGAAYLPDLVGASGVKGLCYLSLTPGADFQIRHYRRREWVPHVLQGCSDPAAAFDNWMQRDVLFAREVRRRCEHLGCVSLVNDGTLTVEEMTRQVAAHFGLPPV